MLAEQFHAAASKARTTASLDETARLTWRAHAEAQILDAEAEAISEAIEARRATLIGKGLAKPPKPAPGRPGGIRRLERREKMFGMGRPLALDRNAKVRIMHWGRCLARRTEKGRAYGVVTAKALAVLEALLWGFHNAKSGVCFPSYERIAEAAGCARSTVAEAIKALEDAGVLSWVQRVKRVREHCGDLLGDNGWRWRVLRTSNAYAFADPSPAADRPNSSKSEKPTGRGHRRIFPKEHAKRDRGSATAYLSLFRLVVSAVAWLNRLRGMLTSANRWRSCGSSSESALTMISTVSSLAWISTRTGLSSKSTSCRRPDLPRIMAWDMCAPVAG
jgi:Helix-turn-helix domain